MQGRNEREIENPLFQRDNPNLSRQIKKKRRNRGISRELARHRHVAANMTEQQRTAYLMALSGRVGDGNVEEAAASAGASDSSSSSSSPPPSGDIVCVPPPPLPISLPQALMALKSSAGSLLNVLSFLEGGGFVQGAGGAPFQDDRVEEPPGDVTWTITGAVPSGVCGDLQNAVRAHRGVKGKGRGISNPRQLVDALIDCARSLARREKPELRRYDDDSKTRQLRKHKIYRIYTIASVREVYTFKLAEFETLTDTIEEVRGRLGKALHARFCRRFFCFARVFYHKKILIN